MDELKAELESKKGVIEKVVKSMGNDTFEHYQELTTENDRLKRVRKISVFITKWQFFEHKGLLEQQEVLDSLIFKVEKLKEEISQSPLKQDVMKLF